MDVISPISPILSAIPILCPKSPSSPTVAAPHPPPLRFCRHCHCEPPASAVVNCSSLAVISSSRSLLFGNDFQRVRPLLAADSSFVRRILERYLYMVFIYVNEDDNVHSRNMPI
ncbi:hypothetical protein Fot_50741 [Forsythia ovata]|uniref:Uncharacterized protein n=1 Tax=Forsythia ovata TaxID=205694 RepID=A0ABD1PZ59_9LAMI